MCLYKLENDKEEDCSTSEEIVNVQDTEPEPDTEIIKEDIECDCDCEFDKDRILNLLEQMYPNLREELMYTAPEILWLKIKHITGVDIINLMDTFEKKKCLKRKADSPDSPDENYTNKHFNM